MVCMLFSVAAGAEGPLLFSFEEGIEGWECELNRAVVPTHKEGRAKEGKSSLAFDFAFSEKYPLLQCRGLFPEGRGDFSNVPGFAGFSAWVYLSRGFPNWELQMFCRSGREWTWRTGPALKKRSPGWHKVSIPAENIATVSNIKDLGIQIRNPVEPLRCLILIDQVEMILLDSSPSQH